MGLDMYAYKRTYVGNYWEEPANQLKLVKPDKSTTRTMKSAIQLIDEAKISSVTEQIAYWRKANAIHSWFVNNVQEGVDDCKEHSFGTDELQQLVDLCNKVLEVAKTDTGMVSNGQTFKDGKWENIMVEGTIVTNPEEVAELLPPTEGFFFGSTDIDGYFLEDIKLTVKQLEPYLEKNDEGEYVYRFADFFYQSSW